jgi:ADP-dependent NAD(P)H-hydrate dehydratase
VSDLAALDRAWMGAHPLPIPGDGGKEARGRVLVVGGGLEMAGAVLLAGTAALRAGAGKLQLATVAGAVVALNVAMPEARVFALPETDGRPSAQAADILAEHVAGCDALLIGPGMMRDAEGMAKALLDLAPGPPMVLDAGALNAVEAARPHSGGLILTPHSGEMARLLGREKTEIEADPLAAARQAAERFGAVVVMKGARTHVVGPDGVAGLYAGGGIGLGVSGSGDVLGGLITGLLARGVPPFEAAAWGVFLHGEAGARLSKRIGTLGFLAREIAGEVPAVMAGLE